MAKKITPKKDWYKDDYVSDRILNTPLDISKGFKWSTNQNNDSPYETLEDIAFAKEEYKKNNLKFYESKEEMRNYLGAKFWENHDLDSYWRQYLKRDALLANGQYSDIRLNDYRNNYLKAMERAYGYNEQAGWIIAAIKSLTADEFYAIAHVLVDKQFWKKDKRSGEAVPTYTSYLPDISDMYPSEDIDIDEVLSDFEENLKEGFKRIGKNYLSYDDYLSEERDRAEEEENEEVEDFLKEEEERNKEIDRKIENLNKRAKRKKVGKYAKNASRIIKRLSKDRQRQMIEGASDKEIEVRYVIQNRERIRRGKKGAYMPFTHKEAVKEAVRRLKKAGIKY